MGNLVSDKPQQSLIQYLLGNWQRFTRGPQQQSQPAQPSAPILDYLKRMLDPNADIGEQIFTAPAGARDIPLKAEK